MRAKNITGRKCYDHLGGQLGSILLDFYLDHGLIQLIEGRTTVYSITEKGYTEFEKIGLHLEKVKNND